MKHFIIIYLRVVCLKAVVIPKPRQMKISKILYDIETSVANVFAPALQLRECDYIKSNGSKSFSVTQTISVVNTYDGH